MALTIKVNGKNHSVDVDGDTPFLWVLRDVLGMTVPSSAAAWRRAAPGGSDERRSSGNKSS